MPLTRTDLLTRAMKIAPLCLEFELSLSKPTKPKQIAYRQKQISRPIPQAITDFAQHIASRFSIQWKFDPAKVDDSDFDEDIQGSGEFEFDFYQVDLTALEAWQLSFSHWQQHRSEPNPFEYDNLFPLFQIMNGDLIVSIIEGEQAGAVYYLDHESGSGDWKRLAPSVDQFLTTLAELWFPDLEWHGSLENFYDEELQQLSTKGKLAQQLTTFITENA